MRQSLAQFIERTTTIRSVDELFAQFDIFTGAYGVDVSSYHITAERLHAVPIEIGLIRETFPDAWVDTYLKRHYENIDPVIAQSRREAKPFHWFDVGKKIALTPAQEHFLEELQAAGLSDGLAVPVFGPMGTIAYFGLGACGGELDLSEAEIIELQCACHQVHNRYLEVSGHNKVDPNIRLSGREKQVLSLIATGLSNNHVASRLSISENTVDTIVRRTFAKLGVNNRITAVLRGIGCGLILP
ncbi:MAG: LuxR family transcriptional regulator [Pseudomonadota bacterium]